MDTRTDDQPDLRDQVPDLIPFLRPGDKVVYVDPQPLDKPSELPDPLLMLAKLCGVTSADEIGNRGSARASVTLDHRLQAPGQGDFTVLFGRDSLFIADTVKEEHPRLVRATLMELAEHMGMREHLYREEEFGRILHEMRDPRTDPIAEKITRESKWEWPFYGTVDASPLFVRLLHWYVTQSKEGAEFLYVSYNGRDGLPHTMFDALRFVMRWIVRRLNTNPEGILEFRPLFENSLRVQSMEDSHLSHVNERGELPRYNLGVSSTEDQGHVYEALLSAIDIYRIRGAEYRSESRYFRHLASSIKRFVIEKLWVTDERGGYFASGTARDDHGRLMPLRIRKAIPTLLLNTRLLNGGARERQIVADCARMLFSKPMLAAPGPRTLAVGEPFFSPGGYHMGTVWPFMVMQIAEGLRRRKFRHLARELDKRLVTSIETVKLYVEYFSGDPSGAIRLNDRLVKTFNMTSGRGEQIEKPPQEVQGWTVASYILAKKRLREELLPIQPFEQDILDSL